jgi:hypothetical protein
MTLGSVRPSADVEPVSDFFFPGATANAHFYDVYYGGNPGNYKTFAWGFDDACLNLPSWTTYTSHALARSMPYGDRYQGDPRDAGRELKTFRSRIPVNTYAESAPTAGFADATAAFQVGVDRILIRTVTFPSYTPRPRRPPPPYDPFSETGLRRQPKRLQAVASCLMSPLVFEFANVLSGTAPAWMLTDVPRWIRDLVGSRFLVMDGSFAGSLFKRQRAFILFTAGGSLPPGTTAGFARGAALARDVRSRGSGADVQQVADVVILWRLRPSAHDAAAISDCIFA